LNNVITQLGYLRFTVTDMEAWRSLAGDVLGFDLNDAGNGDLYCRIDESSAGHQGRTGG